MKAILAKKSGMETIFDSNGKMFAATKLQMDPCLVDLIKSDEKDGYVSVRISLGEKKTREIREFDLEGVSIGQQINMSDLFKEGDLVSVSGVSRGKGFAGVVKRYRFKGGPRTHGQSDRERAPGSSASTTTPGRVFKGKRMAGKVGRDSLTVKNLEVLKIDLEKNYLYVKGPVPGANNSLLVVRQTI
jgi:large subunit ribosomal protein L3